MPRQLFRSFFSFYLAHTHTHTFLILISLTDHGGFLLFSRIGWLILTLPQPDNFLLSWIWMCADDSLGIWVFCVCVCLFVCAYMVHGCFNWIGCTGRWWDVHLFYVKAALCIYCTAEMTTGCLIRWHHACWFCPGNRCLIDLSAVVCNSVCFIHKEIDIRLIVLMRMCVSNC